MKNIMTKKNKYANTTVSFIFYQFLFCPRYRRKIFLDKNVRKRFRELTKEICQYLNVEIISLKIGDDYVHLSLKTPPDLSASQLMSKIKTQTSKKLRNEFTTLQHLKSLWTRTYFVSTIVDVPEETIRKYIESQKKRG